jgi:hypothetical protein
MGVNALGLMDKGHVRNLPHFIKFWKPPRLRMFPAYLLDLGTPMP